MPDNNDMDLLQEFARHNSEAAFAELVRRHINLVYSVALRYTASPGDAEDVAQAVFIILARKSARLSDRTVLTGWLYETTRLTAAGWLRTQMRRQAHELEAYMQSTLDQAGTDNLWRQLAPHLEAAMSRLGERDRALLALRFYENKTGAEAAALLGIRAEAAHKRTARALEKLRQSFVKRGVNSTGAILAGTISTNAVSAAPAGLAIKISAVAVAKGAAAGTTTLALVKGALKIMTWTKMKTAVVVGVGVLVAAGTTTVVVQEFIPTVVDEKWFDTNGDSLAKAPNNLRIIRPTHFGGPTQGSAMRGMDERIVCKNMSLQWGLAFADNFASHRLALPTDFPPDGFDYLITLPPNSKDGSQDRVRIILRDVIKKKYGFVAHRETQEHDVLLLKVKNPNAAGLKKIVPFDPNFGSPIQSSVEGLNSKNFPLNWLAEVLESHLQIPVLDQTGLTNHIALDLHWDKIPGETVADTTRRVVLDQLGLELVPSREPIEMLVVEKVK